MPLFCKWCGAQISPDSRFCEECGHAKDPTTDVDSGCQAIPRLELHEGLLGAGRALAVMEVFPGELRIYRLPDYFTAEVEDLRNRLDNAWLQNVENLRDGKEAVVSWDWCSEPLLSAVAECRSDLVQGLIVMRTEEIISVVIEQIQSDTAWDLMTISSTSKKCIFDLTGPVAWHAVKVLRAVLGERVRYEEG